MENKDKKQNDLITGEENNTTIEVENQEEELDDVVISETVTNNTSEKQSALGKTAQGVKSAGKAIGKGATAVFSFIKKNTLDKAVDGIDKIKKEKELNKFFETQSETFFINDKTIFAVKDIESKTLIFRVTDSDIILGGVEIKSDNLIFEIKDIDKKKTFNFTYNDTEYDLKCFKVNYTIKEKLKGPETVINQITNTVNVAANASVGDINQVAQINNDLRKIESLINGFKPGILGKGKKEQEEAKSLFVSFKSAVNNEIPKDSKLFDKFIKVLGVILPTAVTIAKALWG